MPKIGEIKSGIDLGYTAGRGTASIYGVAVSAVEGNDGLGFIRVFREPIDAIIVL